MLDFIRALLASPFRISTASVSGQCQNSTASARYDKQKKTQTQQHNNQKKDFTNNDQTHSQTHTTTSRDHNTQPQRTATDTQQQHTITMCNHNTQPQHSTHNHKDTTTKHTSTTTFCAAGGHESQGSTYANWRPWRQPDANSLTQNNNPKPEDPQAKSRTTKLTTMATCSSPGHENK